jgi:hypothetical protein
MFGPILIARRKPKRQVDFEPMQISRQWNSNDLPPFITFKKVYQLWRTSSGWDWALVEATEKEPNDIEKHLIHLGVINLEFRENNSSIVRAGHPTEETAAEARREVFLELEASLKRSPIAQGPLSVELETHWNRYQSKLVQLRTG